MWFKSEIISNYMKEHNLTEKEMAQKCDIKLCYLKRLLKKDTTVKMTYFLKVVDVIGCRADDFRK